MTFLSEMLFSLRIDTLGGLHEQVVKLLLAVESLLSMDFSLELESLDNIAVLPSQLVRESSQKASFDSAGAAISSGPMRPDELKSSLEELASHANDHRPTHLISRGDGGVVQHPSPASA